VLARSLDDRDEENPFTEQDTVPQIIPEDLPDGSLDLVPLSVGPLTAETANACQRSLDALCAAIP